MLADANVLVAALAGPDHPNHDRSREAITQALETATPLRVLPTTMSEIQFVLRSKHTGYGWDRETIYQALTAVVEDLAFSIDDPDTVQHALTLYAAHPIDLDDCYLAAVAASDGQTVFSFDGDFDRLRRAGLAI